MATATINTGLRASPQTSGAVGVDRENSTVNGCLIAEAGVFRDGRGEFDDDAIRKVRDLMAQHARGVKCRFSHPTMLSDGLGAFLGRVRNPRVVELYRDGGRRLAVRGDLFLSATAFATPDGDLASYAMDIAEEDASAVGLSLVLEADQEFRLDAKGRRLTAPGGAALPPLWKPTRIYGVDLVDDPNATHSLLSTGYTSTTSARDFEQMAARLLDQAFGHIDDPEVIRARCAGWIRRYCDLRYGPGEEEHRGASADPRIRRNRLRRADPAIRRLLHPVPPPAFRAGDEPGLLPAIIEGLAAPFAQAVREPDGTLAHYCSTAFDDCLARVRRGELAVNLLWGHNEEFGVFATTDDGTLCLYPSADGLRFQSRLPDNENGREVARRMLGGWVGVSAEYAIDDERLQQGGYRTLLSAELSEISLTTNPVFSGTYASVRPLYSEGHLWQAIFSGG